LVVTVTRSAEELLMTASRNGVVIAAMFILARCIMAQAPGTAFTYQGRLDHSGAPASGLHDMRFRLWASENDPNSPIGPVVCKDNVDAGTGLRTAARIHSDLPAGRTLT
jgi:hypothetical protein